jgi:MtrB/PioB family decaheme-associated outer membrane protein
MKFAKLIAALAFLALFLPPGLFAQEKASDKDKGQTKEKEAPPQTKESAYGSVEFGVRAVTGDVYGRPDLRTGQCLGCGTPFNPSLRTSKFNEYGDVRDGFYVPRFDLHFDNILGSKNYISLQSQKAVYRDQSYLASFGQYGKFRLQFRYDEIPHIYTNTARTLFTQTSQGVWSFPAPIRAQLQASTPANLPSLMAGTGANAAGGANCASPTNCGVVTNANFITPSIIRRAGTIGFSYDLNAKWNVGASFWREHETGMRPIGLIMNSSPSASVTGGFGLELPESIDYFNNLVRVGMDYGTRAWSVQAAYIGSFFQNNINQMTWDNPFRLTNEATATPLTGRMALYPDNQAHYLNFAGASDVTKYLRFMASINPGWLRQNNAFLPYTTNTAINTCGSTMTQACTSLSVLPAASLGGSKQTLAMNYTLVTTAWRNVQLKAGYRQFDYNNNTPERAFTPVEGDSANPNPASAMSTAFGYNRKNLEVSGEWFFAKKSSFKAGYLGEWMDRTHRDAAHSQENTFLTAVDWVPIRDLLFRLSYSHSDRKPDKYQDDLASDPVTLAPVPCTDTTNVSFTGDQRCHRRFDEAARLRDRADGLVQYSPTGKISFSAFAGTVQDNYNRAGGTNSPTPLNFLTGSAATDGNYYLYGLLKDFSYNYGVDVDYAVSSQVTFFAEYSYERYYKRMISRNRTPISAPTTILTCSGSSAGCDTANNDWESVAREPVNIYTIGVDTRLGKKIYFSTYYSLSAGKGNVFSRPLGDPNIGSGATKFNLNGTNAAVNYPETVNRNHEVALIIKYKLTENLIPKFEYRYQQWDYKDYQTSVMTQYMGCVSPIPNGPPVTNTVPGCQTPILTSNTPNPVGVPSPFYPGFVVGDPSSARYLFLGVDQPSYHAHTFVATLEYRF